MVIKWTIIISTCQNALNSLYVITEENKVTFCSNVHKEGEKKVQVVEDKKE